MKNTTPPKTMPFPSPTLFPLILLVFFSSIQSQCVVSLKSTFIVHVSKSHQPAAISSAATWHSSLLHSLSTASATARPPDLLYSYTHSATGFSARLTADQATELRRHPAVISVVPDEANHLHTTRTPHFLDLTDGSGLWPVAGYASNIIIGVLDTGIWPEIRSFSDVGYDPVPTSWEGVCESGPDFPATSCNRKIIGARIFYKGYEARHGPINETEESKSARDTKGHGTHTASTVAGSMVHNAGFYRYARGTAWGIATKARIAVYKICWKLGCYESDILAAMDRAIDDGVHVISLSVGGKKPRPYDRDAIAIGALHAAQRGVLVSCSAGNSGPNPFTAVNVAPWILTVGASTIDREFQANVELGNGRKFNGVTLYSGNAVDQNSHWELVNGAHCGSQFCQHGELDSSKVTGRIVICDRGGNARVAKGHAVKQAGGAGMIVANTAEYGEELIADPHLLPATMVGQIAGDQIKQYLSTSPYPTGKINFKGTIISNKPPAPMVAAFSSRGPNLISPEIIKPDVIAPGVNILAGWTRAVGPSGLDVDRRRVEFNIISGTSMACPHVSGLAALLRNANPTWTSAAVKSALMTTANYIDNSGNNITDLATGKQSNPFVHGSGHVDPNKAVDPGLVYDTDVSEYVAFLCALGYDSKKIGIFLKEQNNTIDCRAHNMSDAGHLNYPSFSIVFESGKTMVTTMRKVTHVGSYSSNKAVYMVNVNEPPNVKVKVSPNVLVFKAQRRILTYKVSFTSTRGVDQLMTDSSSFGSIEWTDGIRHSVRSPIAVRWVERPDQQLSISSV